MRKLLFGILALLLMSGYVFAGLTITNYEISGESFKPGSRGTVTVYVSNPSACSIPGTCEADHGLSGVAASLYPPPGITMDTRADIGDMSVGSSSFISLPFAVNSNAKSGIYRLDVRFYAFGETAEIRYTTIPITVAYLPEFTLTPDNDILSGIDGIDLIIANNGGTARNVKLTVMEDTAGVVLFGTNDVYIGDLEDTTNVAVNLDSRSAADGPVDVPFVITYEDEIGVSHEETAYVRMTVKKEKLDVTFSQSTDIYTRKDSMLTLSIQNNGDEEISDVKLSFIDNTVRLKNKNELDFGDISPGAESSDSGSVFITTTPGLNLIPAKITWVERNVQKEQDINVPLTITSDADVGVYIETKPAPLMAGQEHTLSVLVSNLGSYRIDNVDVEIDSDVLSSLDITSKQYIGSLENDDFSTVQFKTQISPFVIPGDYSMNVKITYRDQSGDWVTKRVTQPIEIHSMPAQDSGLIFYIIGAIVIAVVVWYFFFRKKKKKTVE